MMRKRTIRFLKVKKWNFCFKKSPFKNVYYRTSFSHIQKEIYPKKQNIISQLKAGGKYITFPISHKPPITETDHMPKHVQVLMCK